MTIVGKRAISLLVGLVLMTAALCAGGCGYGRSGGYQWGGLYRPDVQSVAVPIFRNKSFQSGVELPLTKAVIIQVEARSPYKVKPAEQADTVLEASITEAEMTVVSRDYRTALPRQQLLTLTVDLVWKDLRSGEILLERRGFRNSAVYYPTLGEGQFAASHQTIEELATAIVQEMQADW